MDARSSALMAFCAFAAELIHPAGASADCECPPGSGAWHRFEDSNPGTPDFWWGQPVRVERIVACEHAVRLEFTVPERDVPTRAALVFPRPTPSLVEERRGRMPGTNEFEWELQLLGKEYARTCEYLRSVIQDAGGAAGVVDFRTTPPDRAPLLLRDRKLTLLWRGSPATLRGYLDVYFSFLA